VRVVTEEGEALGIMDVRDAIKTARDRGLDLVEIAPNAKPPVCKIIDYGKFLYEQKKRQHESKKKQVTVSVKEIKFRPGTDDHDYEYRRENARKWLGEGDKVRAAIAFRGREMSHRELGAKILKRLTEELEEFADVEVAPKMEGYQMFTILVPKKSHSPEKKSKAAEPPASLDEKHARAEAEKRVQKAPKPKSEPKPDDDEIF
jgi:translation initiation factor IF-3